MDIHELFELEWSEKKVSLRRYRVRIYERNRKKYKDKTVLFPCDQSFRDYVEAVAKFTKRKVHII